MYLFSHFSLTPALHFSLTPAHHRTQTSAEKKPEPKPSAPKPAPATAKDTPKPKESSQPVGAARTPSAPSWGWVQEEHPAPASALFFAGDSWLLNPQNVDVNGGGIDIPPPIPASARRGSGDDPKEEGKTGSGLVADKAVTEASAATGL